MWKSTNSCGWEYFIVWEDLGSSPMFANCVLFKFLIIFCDMLERDQLGYNL